MNTLRAARLSLLRPRRGLRPILVAIATALAGCATAPVPASRSLADPSNPNAAEAPSPLAVTSGSVRADDAPLVLACPMHPEVTSTEPGQKCPKCGMALVPRRPKP